MSKRPNDDGEPIRDDYVSPFIKFDRFKKVDLKDIKLKPATDYDDGPCTAIHGVLLNADDDHDVGDLVIVGGAQTKLKQKIEKGIALGRLKDGICVRIEHDRMIGQMKNFEVIPNPKDLLSASASDDAPAPF
jgi:hypothetical protein